MNKVENLANLENQLISLKVLEQKTQKDLGCLDTVHAFLRLLEYCTRVQAQSLDVKSPRAQDASKAANRDLDARYLGSKNHFTDNYQNADGYESPDKTRDHQMKPS